jgi:hypothetical protein
MRREGDEEEASVQRVEARTAGWRRGRRAVDRLANGVEDGLPGLRVLMMVVVVA